MEENGQSQTFEDEKHNDEEATLALLRFFLPQPSPVTPV